MKINNLLEYSTPSSDPQNATSPAPKFGRSDKFLEDETVEESTTSGSVATVDTPVGGMQRRGKGSMLQGIKTSAKFPNSKSVKEGVDPHDFDSDEDYYDAVRKSKQKYHDDDDFDMNDDDFDPIDDESYYEKYVRTNNLEEKSKSQAQFRTMAAVAHNPKFAKKVGISQKVGKEFHKADRKQDYKDLPAKVDEEGKGLWANIHAKRERIKSGSGERMRKPGSKGAPTAQNFKDAANEAANPAQQAAIAIAKKKEKGVAEGEAGNYYSIALQMYPQLKQFDRATVITALNNAYEDYLMHYGYEGIGPDEERSMINRAIKGLKKGVAEAGEWTKLPNGNWRNMHTGAQQSTPPKTKKPRRTMGLHASLEQHADDKMKELGHKFKPVDEARVGNRMSDISIGSPKIVHYKGKAVGEVGIDHEASPGNGPYYMKHYLTGKDMVGYQSKQQALADLKYLVMQYEGSELDEGDDPYKPEPHDEFASDTYYDDPKDEGMSEEKQRLDPKCWTGYKKQGTKMKGGVRVNNCVKVDEAELTEEDMLANELFKQLELFKKAQDKGLGSKPQDKGISAKGKDRDIISKDNGEYNDEAGMADNNLETLKRAVDGIDELINTGDNLPEWCQEKIAVAKSMLVTVWDYMQSEENSEVDEDWNKVNHRDKTDGMSRKAVKAYRRENPGSKLQTAVTTKPSKLKPGSKAAKRRKSFCARMSGNKGPMKDEKGRPTPKAKALRRWNCEE